MHQAPDAALQSATLLKTLAKPASSSRANAARRLTVCYPIAGDALGGSHISLKGLLDELECEQDIRVLVVNEVSGGALERFFSGFEQLPDPGAQRVSLQPGRSIGVAKVLRTLGGLWPRIRFLRKQGVDIVHTNDGRSHLGWALAARLAGAKLVWHHRGDPGARGLRLAAPWLANCIITVSNFASPRRRWGAARNPRVVFSPFDVTITADRSECRSRLLNELGCPEDTVLMGYFGNLVARKRPVMFVDAVERLAGKVDRPVMGLLFGEARHSEVNRLLQERLAQPGLIGRCRLMGFRAPGFEFIAACDVLAVTAVDEPLGRTLVEAMLVGTPIVATRSGGNLEALEGGCGVLCPPDDPEALAQAVAECLWDPQSSAQMTKHAAQIAKRRFGRARHCRSVKAIYHELVG